MQKIRKILGAVFEKTALPTNQPIITNNTDLIYRTWLTLVQKVSKYKNHKCIKIKKYEISKNVHRNQFSLSCYFFPSGFYIGKEPSRVKIYQENIKN